MKSFSEISRNIQRGLLFIGLITGILFYSCQNKTSSLVIEHPSNDHTVIRIKGNDKLVLLPIEEKADEARINIVVDNETVQTLHIRLAVNKTDYYVPLDVSEYKGENLFLSIEGISATALSWSTIKTSHEFDAGNREQHRPVYHFSPAYGWMNDPNGMVYLDGEYHLFYQYNPYGSMWGNMHWGHAVTTDLTNWKHLPVAIAPDSLGTIFSGSAVIDKENVSGFGKNAIVAFYTSAGERQTQSVAYSLDKGRTFIKYDKNPVISADIPDFRDPKVIWHSPTQKWIMIVAAGQEVWLYSSENLKDWAYESKFGEGYGNHEGVWECPDLLEMAVDGNPNNKKWVLLLNINPGGIFGGSATQYFTGNFDGKTFTCESTPETVKWMDFGKDHYATVTWSNVPDNRHIAIAWMSNWQYANDVPTQQYRSANSIPRDLSLFTCNKDKQVYLASTPSPEMNTLRKHTNSVPAFEVNKEYNLENGLPNDTNGAYEILFDLYTGNTDVMGLKLFNEKGENVDISLNMTEKRVSMDRRQSGLVDFSKEFPCITWAPIEKQESYKIHMYVDKTSVELFVNDGKVSMTNLVFPTQPYNRISFYSKGGSCKVDGLKLSDMSLTK